MSRKVGYDMGRSCGLGDGREESGPSSFVVWAGKARLDWSTAVGCGKGIYKEFMVFIGLDL